MYFTGGSFMATHADRAAYWSGVISEQRLGGLTIQEFRRVRGIAAHSFRDWRTKLNKEAASKVGWVTVDTPTEVGAKPVITLQMGSISINVSPGFDPQLLRDVVSALEPRC
jgi:hypothetical protein